MTFLDDVPPPFIDYDDGGGTGADGAPGPPGADGAPGPPGPSAVSTDAGNTAILGTDSLIYVGAGGPPGSYVLDEPFNSLAAWSLNGTPTVVAGRTGTCVHIAGASSQYLQYAIAGALQNATITVGFAFRYTDAVASIRHIFQVATDPAITLDGALRVDPTTNTITYCRGTATVVAASPTGVVAANTWAYIEAHITLHDTFGVVHVRVNGSSVINVTGVDTRASTGTVYNTVRLISGISTAYVQEYDDLYIRSGPGGFLGDHPIT